MTVTINVNGLSLVHEGSGAVSRATLPDVCRTPGAGLVPYGNASFSRDLALGTRSVAVDGGHSAAVDGSVFATSVGDEAGSLGGVVSDVVARESRWLTYSFDVRIEGRPACRLTDKKLQNAGNTVDCAGTTQPLVLRDRGELSASPLNSAYAGPYSLEVKVVRKVGEGRALVEDARICVTARDREQDAIDDSVAFDPAVAKKRARLPGRTWEGDTKRGNKRGGKKGKCTFQRLDKRRFEVEVTHPCYAQDPGDKSSVLVDAKPRRMTANMIIGHLHTEAKKKGVSLGARLDSFQGRENATAIDELDEVIDGTFFASQCGDFYFHDDYNWTFKADPDMGRARPENAGKWEPINRTLSDLNVERPIYTAKVERGAAGYVADKPFTVQCTPLVWPSPVNTPDWPAGSVTAPGNGYVDRRTAALVAAGKDHKTAERDAVREVLKNFIETVIVARKPFKNAKKEAAYKSYVVVNEVVNMRFHGFQENATGEKAFARQHPFWTKFGLWNVDDKYRGTHANYRDLWENVKWSFEVAHAADPSAFLILNDYNVEYLPKKWSRASLETTTKRTIAKAANKRKERVAALAARLEVGLDRVRATWSKTEDRKRPVATPGAATAFKDALAAADQRYDTKLTAAIGAYRRDRAKIDDASDGNPNREAAYATQLQGVEAAWKTAATNAQNEYAKALTDAETLFTARRAEERTQASPPADAVVDASNVAQRSFSSARHEAAVLRFGSLHVHHERFAKSAHAASRAFGKTRYAAVASRDKHIARWQKPELFYDLAAWLVKVLPKAVRDKLVIGFQMHYPENDFEKGYTPDAIARCVRRYAKLKLPVCVTELDVTIENTNYVTNARAVAQYEKDVAKWKKDVAAWNKKAAATRGPQPVAPPVVTPTLLKDLHVAHVDATINREAGKFEAEAAKFDQENAALLASETEDERNARKAARDAARIAASDSARATAEREIFFRYRGQFDAAFREQAQRTRRMIEALLSARNVTSINMWSLGDRPGAFRYMGYPFHWGWVCPTKDCPVHGDAKLLVRKPMYAAAVAAFINSKKQYTDAEIRAGAAKRVAEKLDRAEARSTKKNKKKS